MTQPVPDIHSGLDPEEEEKYLLDAFRTVVGYSVNLPPEKLVTVSKKCGLVLQHPIVMVSRTVSKYFFL
jgi:hypothetical protein